jgi:hypothetical protein
VTLPGGRGELYATIVNGAGYTSRELDRFKDFAARLTFAPFATSAGYVQGLQISPWFSLGQRASDFATGKGTVRPVSEGLQRDRYGVLFSLRDSRVSFGVQLARLTDVVETADTTADLAPESATRTGNLWSAHTIIRPLAFGASGRTSPFWVVIRADQFTPVASASGQHRFWVAGASWDVNPRTSVTLDVQSRYPTDGLTGANTRVVFLHLIANF